MVAIVVDPQRLVECAGHISSAHAEIVRGTDALTGGLARCGGMAGHDPAGIDWAAAYDPTSSSLLALCADLAERLATHVHALNQSAAAYGASEEWFGGGPQPGLQLAPAQTAAGVHRRSIPTALGGEPFSPSDQVTQLVVQLVGAVWPNGDPALLRSASSQWGTLSASLDSARRTSLASAAGSLDGLASPTVTAAAERAMELDRALEHLSAGALELSDACVDLARHIDSTHQEVRCELVSLMAELGLTVLLSTLTSAVTAGLGAIVGSVASAGRVGVAVARITALFQRLAALARPAVERIGRLGEALAATGRRMVRFAGGPLPQPVRRLSIGGIARTVERATDNWAVAFLTQGPAAAVAKVLERPLQAAGARLGGTAARRALILGWRADVPGVRGALVRAGHGAASPPSEPHAVSSPLHSTAAAGAREAEAAAVRALGSERTVALTHRLQGALERPLDSVRASLASAAGDAAGRAPSPRELEPDNGERSPDPTWTAELPVPGADGVRLEVPKSLDLGHGIGLDLGERRMTGIFGIDVNVPLPGPMGRLADAGITTIRATDVDENWWRQRIGSMTATAPAASA
jgi:hypothetical protein